MSRDLTTVIRQEQLKLFFRRFGTLALANLLWVALASPVQAQRFEDEIARALAGGCSALGGPLGPNLSRICDPGQIGGTVAETASGGSATALSREGAPVEERKIQRLIGPFNVFVSGEYERFKKDLTRFEQAHETDSWRALVGADYSFGDRLLIGGAFSYINNNGNFKSGGRFDTDSYGGLVHVSLVPIAKSFADFSAGYAYKKHFMSRVATLFIDDSGGANPPVFTPVGTTTSRTDANEFKVGVNAGYNFDFQSLTFGPRLGLNYRRTEIDGFRERGNTGLELIYNSQHENSLTSVLGMYGSIAISTGFGVLIPQTTLEYVHEFLDPQRKISFRFAEDGSGTPFRFENDPPDRNYFNLGAGVVLQLARGVAPFINYRALVGYNDQRSHTVTAGLRVEF